MTRRAVEREHPLEEFFRKRVRLVGGYTIKMAPMEAGIPDRLVLLQGKMFLVELKAEDEEPSEIQRHWHAKVRKEQGIHVYVVTGRDGVVQFLRHAITACAPQTRRGRPPTVRSA